MELSLESRSLARPRLCLRVRLWKVDLADVSEDRRESTMAGVQCGSFNLLLSSLFRCLTDAEAALSSGGV